MSHVKQILLHMLKGNTITPLEALRKFGCFRLGARIWDINEAIKPFKVKSDLVQIGDKKVAEYYFEQIPPIYLTNKILAENDYDGVPWYAILGVSAKASASDINEAYKSLALKLHPDKGGNVKDFIVLNNAYNYAIKTTGANYAG